MTNIPNIPRRKLATGLAIATTALGLGAGPAQALDGAPFKSVTVDCQSAHFYRNYDPSADDFSSDSGIGYPAGQAVTARDGDERTGPRGVRGYVDGGGWGFYSTSCLAGYH